ncbi:alginate lyase family protein [Thermodesulfobacteriota bacterium]
MTIVKKVWYIVRLLGLRVIYLRLNVYADNLLGLSRKKFRPKPWHTIQLKDILKEKIPNDIELYTHYKKNHEPPFLFPLGQPPSIPSSIDEKETGRSPSLLERFELLDEMRCVYFGEQPSPERIDWYHDPFHGGRSDPAPCWCNISCFLPEQGDPRMLWEPSRGAWAIDLARIAARGKHEGPGELLWQWIDDWMDHCPPFNGFQWWCGQESSVRFFGFTIGIWACGKELTPERWQSFARLAWATGYRVYHHINYAISLKNNHALSEAVGLMMIGYLFPEFRSANEWSRKGREVFESELWRQCYPDGTYLQQSHNYHRVMLQDAILGVRLAELSGKPYGSGVYSIVDKATEFLFQMLDPASGLVPLYGNNDGAHLLPLSECDFHDFRPVVQAGHFLVHKKRLLPPGPWDEDALWLIGDGILQEQAEAPRQPQSMRFDDGGYFTLRRPEDETWMMTRCHTYKDRQGHKDALHIDLWWKGINILRDTGTHRYYIPGRPDMEAYFSSMAAHNVVQIDGVDALEKVGRFLILPWGKGSARHFEIEKSCGSYFECESIDYNRKPWWVKHRRAVLSLPGVVWVIVDDLYGGGRHSARWWWHLADGDVALDMDAGRLGLENPAGSICMNVCSSLAVPLTRIIHGQDKPGDVQGFASPTYGRLDKINVLQVDLVGMFPVRMVTVIGLGESVKVQGPDRKDSAEWWTLLLNGRAVKLELSVLDYGADRIVVNWSQR